MRVIVPILILSLVIAACQKENQQDIPANFNGMYAGTFSRTGMDTTNVSIAFFENVFEGESDRPKYPAICRGSFTMGQNSISFIDSCSWTADFDWSLILNGTYNQSYQSSTGNLRIWRTNGTITDEYLLTKVER